MSLFLLLLSRTAIAQGPPAQEQETNPESTQESPEAPVESALAEDTVQRQSHAHEMETLEKRLVERMEKLERKNEAQAKKIDELENQNQKMREDIDEQALEAVSGAELETTGTFDIYGFFDLTFYRAFLEEDSAFKLYLPPKSTFLMSNVNLYFVSQMTERLSALLELRFTFMPHGWTKEYESAARMNGSEVWPASDTCVETDTISCSTSNTTKFDRVNMLVRDPVTTEEYNLGGVLIERVHLTYSPRNWFNIIAGRFLTPYGIWNVDHGSPVVIPARIPYLQTREMVPRAQTGLSVYGRFFPTDILFFDYALTLSNGRGPIEELMDLDENKGVGLKLKLSYEGRSARIALGSYGYVGKYTDLKKTAIMDLDPDMSMNQDVDAPLTSKLTIVEQYDEYVVSADLLIEFLGLKLQGEYVWRYVNYDVPAFKNAEAVVFSGASISDTLYTANYTGLSVYGLVVWDLPLKQWFGNVHVLPYFMYEHSTPNDSDDGGNFEIVQWGVNIKPSPYITLKLEHAHVRPKTMMFNEYANYITAQLAVSF